MIATWEEINVRYDAIKDHKPRATKKLKELGEILASAFKLDRQRADEMWQYIIELNIKDNIEYSKFYIAQVFNKLTENLLPDEAAEFVSMRPERVRLMLLYGYDGFTLNHVVYTIIGNLVKNKRSDESIEIIALLEEKFTEQEGLSIYTFYSVFNSLCESLAERIGPSRQDFRYDIPIDDVIAFYDACFSAFDDEYIQSVAQARKSMVKEEVAQNKDEVESILRYLLEISQYSYGLNVLFTDYLYFVRDVIRSEAESIIYDYCCNAEKVQLPVTPHWEDEKMIAISNWYLSVLSGSQRILQQLFKTQPCQDYLKSILHSFMYDNEWETVLRFLVLGLNQETESGYESFLEFVKSEIQAYLEFKDKKVVYEDGQWFVEKKLARTEDIDDDLDSSFSTFITFTTRSSISKPRITTDNLNNFIQVLGRAWILTSGSNVNEQLVDVVRSFVSRETGNVDILNSMGMETEADYRTELEKLNDYAELESGRREPYDISYDFEHLENEFIRNIQYETETYGKETGKLLAKQPQFLSFLFLHEAHSFALKADIILGAMLDGNMTAALKCVDYMIETTSYPNYSDRNSWSMEIENTVYTLLREVRMKNTSEYEEPYPDSITSSVIQIAEKCLPYLVGDEVNMVKTELVKLQQDNDDNIEYICQLMQNVDEYTVEKKPKGYSKRINSITRSIMQGIETLSELNRMDVVAQILRKIAVGKAFISGPSYESWMTRLLMITDEQLLELYSLIPDIYSSYIDTSDRYGALEILRIFGKTGNLSVYRTLKNKILQKHGYIEGINTCFRYSEETITPIVICKKENIEVSFLYWNDMASNRQNVFGVEMTFSIKNMYKESISLYASGILINGTKLEDLLDATGRELPDKARIGFSYDTSEEKTGDLHLTWGNQKEYPIKEISEISFSVTAQSYNGEIEKDGPFTIRRNGMNETFVLKHEVKK